MLSLTREEYDEKTYEGLALPTNVTAEAAVVEHPLVWPEDVLVALNTLADLIEYYHVGLTSRPEPKFSKFLHGGDAFNIANAEVLKERVTFWLVHVEKWLQKRGKRDGVEVVHVADNCVRVLRAAKF